jgi:hypothetical protein
MEWQFHVQRGVAPHHPAYGREPLVAENLAQAGGGTWGFDSPTPLLLPLPNPKATAPKVRGRRAPTDAR